MSCLNVHSTKLFPAEIRDVIMTDASVPLNAENGCNLVVLFVTIVDDPHSRLPIPVSQILHLDKPTFVETMVTTLNILTLLHFTLIILIYFYYIIISVLFLRLWNRIRDI